VAETRVTATGALIEEDPRTETRATATGALIEEDPRSEMRVTAIGAYVELAEAEGGAASSAPMKGWGWGWQGA